MMESDDEEKASLKKTTSQQRPGLARTAAAEGVQAAYEILESGSLNEVSLQEAIDSTSAEATGKKEEGAPDISLKPKNYWIDVLIQSEDSPTMPRVLSDIFKQFALPLLLARHLQDPEQLQTPQVLTLTHHAFIVMRILSLEDSYHEIRFTAALCMLHTIVTITTTQQLQRASHATTRQLLVNQGSMTDILKRELPEGTVSGATAVWLASHLGRTAAATRQLRLDVIDKYVL
jgi:hypothetical protein